MEWTTELVPGVGVLADLWDGYLSPPLPRGRQKCSGVLNLSCHSYFWKKVLGKVRCWR